jgi:hypothetical protein
VRVGGRHDNFPAILTGVAGPGDKPVACFHTEERPQRQRGIAMLGINTRGRQLPGFGSLHGNHRQVGALDHIDIERLRLAAYPGKVFFTRRCVDDHPVVGVADVIDDQVINDTALLIQHACVQRLAVFLEPRNIIGDEVPQELARTISAKVHNSHVGDIKYTGMLSHRMMFFFLRSIVQRHIPAAEIDDSSACFHVLVVMRCL